MQEIQSERAKRLTQLGEMNQELVRGDDVIEDAADKKIRGDIPLMLILIIGISLFIALWIFVIYLGVGEATVTTTLGTHFAK